MARTAKELIAFVASAVLAFNLFGPIPVAKAEDGHSGIRSESLDKSIVKIKAEIANVKVVKPNPNENTESFEPITFHGTGFFISDRHIVTAHHVLTGETLASEICTTAISDKTYKNVIMESPVSDSELTQPDRVGSGMILDLCLFGISGKIDIAILELPPDSFSKLHGKIAPLSRICSGLSEGDRLLIRGFPFTNGRQNSMPASGQYQGIDSADGTGFVTPSGVTSGFSGAPVVNAAGQLVGVVVQLDDGSTTKIIPIHSIIDAIKRATRSQNTRENSIATRVAKNFETTIPTCYPEKRVSDFVQGCQDNPPREDGTCETCVYTRQQEELLPADVSEQTDMPASPAVSVTCRKMHIDSQRDYEVLVSELQICGNAVVEFGQASGQYGTGRKLEKLSKSFGKACGNVRLQYPAPESKTGIRPELNGDMTFNMWVKCLNKPPANDPGTTVGAECRVVNGRFEFRMRPSQ